jgi:hypothetical protein
MYQLRKRGRTTHKPAAWLDVGRVASSHAKPTHAGIRTTAFMSAIVTSVIKHRSRGASALRRVTMAHGSRTR